MSEDHAPTASGSVRAAERSDNPGQLVADSVEACLDVARTWHAWDGRPLARTVDGKPNTWTPARALRRITDHLIDHLQQVEALLAAAPAIPDTWHGRFVTLDSDWGRFTEADYDEARSRLRRLGRWYVLRYEAAGADAWDEPRGEDWTLREIAEHVAGVRYYAEQVGVWEELGPAPHPAPSGSHGGPGSSVAWRAPAGNPVTSLAGQELRLRGAS